MKSVFYLVTVLFIGALIFGCSSAPSTASGTNNSARTSSISDKGNSGAATSAANQPPAGIAIGSQPVNTDVNAPSAGKLAMADRRRVVDVPGAGPVGAPPSVPAPENSSVSTTMDKSGTFIETRVFRGNPYVSKVVKTSNGPKQTAKIFLGNGQVISVSPAKIPSVNAISVAGLMELAGVRVPSQPPRNSGQTNEMTKKVKQ